MTPGLPAEAPGVVGLLLAAGAGRRAGGPKALRHDADGTSWLERSVRVLLDGGCPSVTVVLGAGAADAQALVPLDPRVRVVEAIDWSSGLGASLRAGLLAVAEQTPTAVLIHLVDLPDVSAAVVRRVLEIGLSPSVLARALFGSHAGHPVLVGMDHLGALVGQLSGDQGAKDLLAARDVRAVPCGDLATGRDDDRPPARGRQVHQT